MKILKAFEKFSDQRKINWI